MEHLTTEALARLVDETPEGDAREHLEACGPFTGNNQSRDSKHDYHGLQGNAPLVAQNGERIETHDGSVPPVHLNAAGVGARRNCFYMGLPYTRAP